MLQWKGAVDPQSICQNKGEYYWLIHGYASYTFITWFIVMLRNILATQYYITHCSDSDTDM